MPPPAPGASDAFVGKEFNTCHKLPVGKRVAKLNLKPDADLADLIAWISNITCKQFVISGNITAGAKKVTIVAPGLMTRDEAYVAFLRALDSLGLTVEKSGRFLKIIETSKAKSSAVPIYDFDGRLLEKN